jgi:hypothetical protein
MIFFDHWSRFLLVNGPKKKTYFKGGKKQVANHEKRRIVPGSRAVQENDNGNK